MAQNELAAAVSPYLLQHKDNPVHWRMWGEAALAEARRVNRPILLSIGYAACHWCHVMAHESFEDAGVAAVMNELFINIKVDREERPDIDEVYMAALHALGQPGGWPLTMFLTPTGEPFWGGTYFPKEARYGRAAFVDVLRAIAATYHAQPEKVAKNAKALRAAILETKPTSSDGQIMSSTLDFYAERLAGSMDRVNGGIRGAPKFPNPAMLEFLWRHAARTKDAASRGAFLLTLRRMCEGGIYDQLGGGFARYSVDERWLVPHFEKMLYDNVQLLELLSLAWLETREAIFEEAVRETVEWLRREMRAPSGAFCASLDADSEGIEGKFYVWTRDEIEEVLGQEDAAFFARSYDVRGEGNWSDEHHGGAVVILNRLQAPSAGAEDRPRLVILRGKLLARRNGRTRPGRDDKVLADWNGLTIAALVHASAVFGQASWMTMAREAFDFISTTMVRTVDGQPRLGHAWRGGALVWPAMASDYAAMMRAALALAEAGTDGDAESLCDLAQRFSQALEAHHLDPATGFLYTSADDAPDVVFRARPTTDDATPNAHAVYAQALLKLSSLTGQASSRARADRLLDALTPTVRANPFGHTSLLNALDQRLHNIDIVITGPDSDPLRRAALAVSFLNRTVRPAMKSGAAGDFAEIAAYPRDRAAAFICAEGRCSLPVTRPEDIAERVASMRQ
jgi:uncharacterized protein YyaL (SSP411 family)